MKLRHTHYEQLLTYFEDVESSGWYYGNKEQFIKRHNELKEWVNNMYSKQQNSDT
jgi:hypothetical protein